MTEGVCILTAEQAGIAATALAMLAMRVGGESPEAADALKALRTQAPDPRVEVERLRGLLKRARIQIATHIHGRKVHDEIAAALGEVPTR